MLTLMVQDVELHFEHSLVSLSKWEALHEKAFFGKDEKTEEDTLSYISQMLLTENPPEDWLKQLTPNHILVVNDYLNSKQTATWFPESPSGRGSSEIVTAELIYYWMINFQIPFSCEDWHLNRLMTLIKVCGIKQTKPKKMSRSAQAEQYRQMNAERRARLGTTG